MTTRWECPKELAVTSPWGYQYVLLSDLPALLRAEVEKALRRVRFTRGSSARVFNAAVRDYLHERFGFPEAAPEPTCPTCGGTPKEVVYQSVSLGEARKRLEEAVASVRAAEEAYERAKRITQKDLRFEVDV